jgi:hypothetical protein
MPCSIAAQRVGDTASSYESQPRGKPYTTQLRHHDTIRLLLPQRGWYTLCNPVDNVFQAGCWRETGCAHHTRYQLSIIETDMTQTACAIVPLTARTIQPDAEGNQAHGTRSMTEEKVHISNHIPQKPEYVLLGQQSELTNSYMAPTLKASIGGSGFEASGFGVNKQKTALKSFTISLVPTLDTHDGQPDYLQW